MNDKRRAAGATEGAGAADRRKPEPTPENRGIDFTKMIPRELERVEIPGKSTVVLDRFLAEVAGTHR